ncbi:Pimeloyl-ACP methyl ester carboxylesterase [Rhizobium sp. NFR07]|uniref:alpha/beta fold hydrolase n=1 Tax=Rhizobium sp. NFR07 TaxID=1566262 RepID=UPI0008E7670F|nr:alpha/beta hydrolase [Rhizobium sp. NFR07]SFA93589.1 Pimeloyl-ACP methyl ester carboxylesterase [Rhizobium sp. NFR07]
MSDTPGNFTLRDIEANGTRVSVASAGSGPPVLFFHGWPHTWEIWRPVMERLQSQYTVIAPDLRGLGASERAKSGYDLHTLADDAVAVLDALDIETAGVVGIDLGTAISWMFAMRHPGRVSKLAVMEGLVGALPGAEGFLSKGPPWWFGFHGTPDLAETVLQGNEAAYIDWFLKAGTKDRRGVDASFRDAFVNAYASPDAMRSGFAHYRAFAENARQIDAIVAAGIPDLPILAIAGGVVGDALAGQLRPISAALQEDAIPDCAHLVPLEQPAALATKLDTFFK